MWAPQSISGLLRSSSCSNTGVVSTAADAQSSQDKKWRWCDVFASSQGITRQQETLKKLNPFQTVDHIDAREWAKLAVGLCFLAPLRMILLLVVIFVASIFVCLTVVGIDVEKPLSPGRARVQHIIGYWAGLLCCLCAGISVEVKGTRADPDKCKMLVVAPHSTALDSFVISFAVSGVSIVGKKEAASSVIGPFLNSTQTIFVDRENKNNRSMASDQIKERVRLDSPWKRQVLLFPEGTCTNRTSLISFRKGAFEPGEPVQPILMRWRYTNFDPTWTAGAPSRTLVAIRTLSQLFNSVTVEFLPVQVPTNEEIADPCVFAENVRQTMATCLGIPVSEHSYADSFLAKLAAKNKLRPAKALPFSLQEIIQEEAKRSGILLNSNDLYDMARKLLLCVAKAPGMTSDATLTVTQFEAIAQLCAEQIGLKKELCWSDIVNRQWPKSETIVGFRALLQAHLEATYSVR